MQRTTNEQIAANLMAHAALLEELESYLGNDWAEDPEGVQRFNQVAQVLPATVEQMHRAASVLADPGSGLRDLASVEDGAMRAADRVMSRAFRQAWAELYAEHRRVLALLRGFYDYCTEAGVLFHDECYQNAVTYFAEQETNDA